MRAKALYASGLKPVPTHTKMLIVCGLGFLLLISAAIFFVVRIHHTPPDANSGGRLGTVRPALAAPSSHNGGNETDVSWDKHYPKFPKTMRFPVGDITLLASAKTRAEIAAWADDNPATRHALLASFSSFAPYAEWMVIMYPFTSGVCAWKVHLYAYYPKDAKDARPWKLMFVGDGGQTDGPWGIDSIYIDTARAELVVASHDGRVFKAIPIRREMELVGKP